MCFFACIYNKLKNIEVSFLRKCMHSLNCALVKHISKDFPVSFVCKIFLYKVCFLRVLPLLEELLLVKILIHLYHEILLQKKDYYMLFAEKAFPRVLLSTRVNRCIFGF